MHSAATFSTMFPLPLHVSDRRPRCALVTPQELYAVILLMERQAAEAARDGRIGAADALLWRPAALREAAR